LRESLNVLGNLGFVVSGLAIFAVLARDSIENRSAYLPLLGSQPIALRYAAATVFLGPGSMLKHASHTFFGAWADNLSMVEYICSPCLLNLAILGRWREPTLFLI
jgi:hypothetical protein